MNYDKDRKEKLILKIKECNSLHNNCDYLLEHNDCDDIVEYIEECEFEYNQLKQENEGLKEVLRGTTHCFDEEEHQRLNNILTEFENWLEKQRQNNLNDNFVVIRLADIKAKLQELKGNN